VIQDGPPDLRERPDFIEMNAYRCVLIYHLLSTLLERDAMKIDRRNLLFAAAAVTTTISRSAQGCEQRRRVSQQELDDAILLHGTWLADINTGRRCMFAGRDLSGLRFEILGGGPIDLNGADFAQADLSRTEADEILVHHCNFNGANFDGCRWRQPIFAFADMRRASAKKVEWGNPSRRDYAESLPADFRHTVLSNTDLTEARIRGYFYCTKLVGACLIRADLSQSDFVGLKHCEMSFSGAQLSGARLRDCRVSSVSFFHADCSGVDFSHTVFSDVQMKGCNLSRARFRGAEIEHTMFSPDTSS
jgi:uncharacterized protein YjbI with pentapeptide repeats